MKKHDEKNVSPETSDAVLSHCRCSSNVLRQWKPRLACLAVAWNRLNDYDGFFAMPIKTLQAVVLACVIGYPLFMFAGILYLVWEIHVSLLLQWLLWLAWVTQWISYEAYLAFLEYRGFLAKLSE